MTNLVVSTIGTHSGSFHADDVVGVAVLKLLYPEATVLRSRDPTVLDRCEVLLDVGNVYDAATHRYDHHQATFMDGRDVNGLFVPYASSGLIWKHFGLDAIRVVVADHVSLSEQELQALALRVDQEVVSYVDMLDVGLKVPGPFLTSLSGIISAMNPTYLESTGAADYDFHFGAAVEFARVYLRRLIYTMAVDLSAMSQVHSSDTYHDGKVLVLTSGLPWTKAVCGMPEVLYVVYPATDGTWMLQCARDAEDSFENRKPLPSAWAGLRWDELSKVCQVDGAVFCHRGLFIAGHETKEGAIRMAAVALSL